MSEITATQKTTSISEGQYELFTEVEMTGADDKLVMVKQSIGTFTLVQLESQKASYQTRIDEVQVKIDAISKLTA